jgi:hypothetical protein
LPVRKYTHYYGDPPLKPGDDPFKIVERVDIDYIYVGETNRETGAVEWTYYRIEHDDHHRFICKQVVPGDEDYPKSKVKLSVQ